MYKHTVKSKLAQARSADATSAASASPAGQRSKSTLATVGASRKFFSHIRHKIEDNLTPRLASKLYCKSSKHTRSLSALSLVDGGSVGGKYTPKMGSAEPPLVNAVVMMPPPPSLSASYLDSDEESNYSLSLSLTQQSLEDEIFAELEKVAHDESKLNAVLQSFDQILNDFPPEEQESESIVAIAAIQQMQTQSQQVWALAHSHSHSYDCPAEVDEAEAPVLPAPPAAFCDRQILLAKSHSSLSIGRRLGPGCQLYQTPELATSLLQLRKSSSGLSPAKYNSLWELSQSTGGGSRSRIPLLKPTNMGKRSESFNQDQAKSKVVVTSKQRTRSMLTLNCTARKAPAATQPVKTVPKRANSTLERGQLPKNTPAASTVSGRQPKRANSTLEGNAKRRSRPLSQASASSRPNSTHSDELLAKCLAKGHEILRKVETMNAPKPTAQRSRSNRASNPTKKQLPPKLQYANEEKVRQPKLEACKIIPPKLGETSDKHVELLVKVVQEAKPVKPAKKHASLEDLEDSDDSGHISNTAHSASSAPSSRGGSLCESEGEVEPSKSTCAPKSTTKIAELLQKFELKAATANQVQTAAATRKTSSNPLAGLCTATKVAQVEPVRCIQTQVEIFPTYTKEVTMRLH